VLPAFPRLGFHDVSQEILFFVKEVDGKFQECIEDEITLTV
jgi:hypothetical protein